MLHKSIVSANDMAQIRAVNAEPQSHTWLSTLMCKLNYVKTFSSSITHVTFQGLQPSLFSILCVGFLFF